MGCPNGRRGYGIIIPQPMQYDIFGMPAEPEPEDFAAAGRGCYLLNFEKQRNIIAGDIHCPICSSASSHWRARR